MIADAQKFSAKIKHILRKPAGEVAEYIFSVLFWILRLRFAPRRMTNKNGQRASSELIFLTMRLLRRYAPRNDKLSNLQSFVDDGLRDHRELLTAEQSKEITGRTAMKNRQLLSTVISCSALYA